MFYYFYLFIYLLFQLNLLLRDRGLALDEGLVDVGDDASARDSRGLDEGVELLVAADGELQVPGGDTLHLEVLARVPGKLEHLCREVLQDGPGVDGGGGAHTAVRVGALLQQAVDTAHGELEPGAGRAGDGLAGYLDLLGLGGGGSRGRCSSGCCCGDRSCSGCRSSGGGSRSRSGSC